MLNFRESISKEEINSLPVLEYEGRNIVLVDTLSKLKTTIEVLKNEEVLGFDTETKPSFEKGKMNKVALLQLSTADTCYLIRLNVLGMQNPIIEILSSEKPLKIGLSLKDDYKMLNRRRSFKPAGFLDLQSVIGKFGIKDLSLQKIYAIMFNKKISKSQRLTNWQAPNLTLQQQKYAAVDAWACMDIYNVIKDEL
ncbi:MAG: 3'-5' exonuclease [Paludibacteraceae bacterium]|jgi:ribonuclease D|nr:3'-5' exonuclease [Paludibacteraceae bacterium]